MLVIIVEKKKKGTSERATVERRYLYLETASQLLSKHYVILLVLLNEQNCLPSEAMGFNCLPLCLRASQEVRSLPSRVHLSTLNPENLSLIHSTNTDTHSVSLQSGPWEYCGEQKGQVSCCYGVYIL